MNAQIAATTLTAEDIRHRGSLTPIPRKMVWHLREQWKIPTVKPDQLLAPFG
jgi:hypothetical protein